MPYIGNEMLFNSIYFLFLFLPVFFTIYFLLPDKFKNAFTLLASIFFYAWGAPAFVFVLSGAVIADFFFAQRIYSASQPNKKYWLLAAISINIGLLAYFKYCNFFIENISLLLGLHSNSYVKAILPIGISFFTFHELSYLIDVYRDTKKPFKNIINYALYIFLFPQLVAGPIIRFNEIADQIEDRKKNETIDNRLLGFFRFIVGLTKKILIADVLGNTVVKIFSLSNNESGMLLNWTGAVLNFLHFYIDFSAYSDMAIGLALIMGFKFPENFNAPLISQSVTEFWQRWHISLSRWLKDYLYIPLGGSKLGQYRTALNIIIVFAISGLWHGAQWKYVTWGFLFGLVVAAERLVLLKHTAYLGKIGRIVFTFFICTNLLILLACEDMKHAWQYWQVMYSFKPSTYQLFINTKTLLAIVLALVISFGAGINGVDTFIQHIFTKHKTDSQYAVTTLATITLLVICASFMFVTAHKPFLYFKF